MEMVKWKDIFGEEHLFMEGKGDDVFHVIPNKRDEEENSFTEILSKRALIEMAARLQSK